MIEHLAIWSKDLEQLKAFYLRYFNCQAGERYCNPRNGFAYYFLSFASGARLELMQMPGIANLAKQPTTQYFGFAHMAIALGSAAAVDALYQRLLADGVEVLDQPHHTGDGYYEFTLLDPEANRIEITI